MKQTLLAIRRTTNVTTYALAALAQLPVADVVAVEVGGYTCRENALKVVHAFNVLSGMRLTIEDIAIHEVSRS